MEITNDLTLTVFIAFLSFTNWRIEGRYAFGIFFPKMAIFPYNAVFHQTRASIQNVPLPIVILCVNK